MQVRVLQRDRAKERKAYDKVIVASTVMRKRKTEDADRKMIALAPPPDPLLCIDDDGSSAAHADETDGSGENHTLHDRDAGTDMDSVTPTLRPPPLSAALEPSAAEIAAAANATSARRLLRKRKCWLCKTPYDEVHFFYDQFCPDCAAFNYSKRQSSADLTGRVALVSHGPVMAVYTFICTYIFIFLSQWRVLYSKHV